MKTKKHFENAVYKHLQDQGLGKEKVSMSVLNNLIDFMYKTCLGQLLPIDSVMPSLNSEPKTKDDMLLEILSPLGTEIPDPTGEYADLFAYLYDKISPIIRNEA